MTTGIQSQTALSCGPASGLDSATLVDVALQVYSRAIMYDTQGLHERAMECRTELLRRLEAACAVQAAPETTAEQFIQAAIDTAPEPLRRLGEYLSRVLVEDQWTTAEGMLLGVASAAQQASAAVPEGWKPDMAHASNEWADVACNGLQWLRNIRDGISVPDRAISDMEAGIKHCREVRHQVTTAVQPVSAAVPEGYQLVPIDLLKRAAEAINWGLEPDSPPAHDEAWKELRAILIAPHNIKE